MPKNKDGLTDHQRYVLANAVSEAYWAGWKGSLRTKDRPRVTLRRKVVSISVNTRAALYRAGMTDDDRRLTKKGVEVGEAELLKRYDGVPAAKFIGDQREEQAKKRLKEARRIQDLAANFKGIKSKNRMGKKVSLATKIEEELRRSSYVALYEEDLWEIAAGLRTS